MVEGLALDDLDDDDDNVFTELLAPFSSIIKLNCGLMLDDREDDADEYCAAPVARDEDLHRLIWPMHPTLGDVGSTVSSGLWWIR